MVEWRKNFLLKIARNYSLAFSSDIGIMCGTRSRVRSSGDSGSFLMSSGGWSVAHTYAAQERKAVTNLERQGFEAFCPLFKRPSKTDLFKLTESPLFPCYVFVLIEPGRQWHSINNTFGVIRLMSSLSPRYTSSRSGGFGKHSRVINARVDPAPLFVPDQKIEYIRTLCKTVDDPLPPGTLVRVRNKDSAFYETVGTVVELDKTLRVTVLMQIFNRDVNIQFANVSDLQKL